MVTPDYGGTTAEAAAGLHHRKYKAVTSTLAPCHKKQNKKKHARKTFRAKDNKHTRNGFSVIECFVSKQHTRRLTAVVRVQKPDSNGTLRIFMAIKAPPIP